MKTKSQKSKVKSQRSKVIRYASLALGIFTGTWSLPAQTPLTLFKGTALPAECSPVDAEVLFFLVNQTSNTGSLYYCSALNKWSQIGGTGTAGSPAVASVFGRTGAIAAQAGDYTPAQVGAAPGIVAVSGTSGTVAFNCPSAGGPVTSFTGAGGNALQVTGNLTVTSSGCAPGQILDLWLEQNGSANYTVTWPAGWDPAQLVQAPNVAAHYEYILDASGIGHYSSGSNAGFDQFVDTSTPAKSPPPGFTFTYTKNGMLCRLNSSGVESCL